MVVGRVYERISALLEDYLEQFRMTVDRGPLRAAGELTRGIVWTGSVQLSNAVRLWARTPRELAYGVNRLSRQLAQERWDHRAWAAGLLAEQARSVGDDSLIPIDATELAKPYARRMEYQCTVRDASRPGNPLVAGYWCWGAYHWQAEQAILDPLMLRPYSTNQPEFLSENDQWRSCMRSLHQATGGRGIWVMDRGADRPEIFAELLDVPVRWIVRLRGDRPLIGPDGTTRPADAWADWALAHQPEQDRAVAVPVHLPVQYDRPFRYPGPLSLVVPTYTSADDERWLPLTRGVVEHGCGLRPVRRDYAFRWRAEDAKRFLGQIWHVERFLVRSFLAIERMLCCVVAAGGFLAMLQRDYPALAQSLQTEVLYWDKPIKLPGCRLARGVIALTPQHGLLPVTA